MEVFVKYKGTSGLDEAGDLSLREAYELLYMEHDKIEALRLHVGAERMYLSPMMVNGKVIIRTRDHMAEVKCLQLSRWFPGEDSDSSRIKYTDKMLGWTNPSGIE